MIDAIAKILNEAISLGVQTPIGWAQLINGKPYEYKGAGQWAPIAEDTAGAWSYMRLNGQVNVTGAQVDGIACGVIAAQIPIRYAAMLPREDCDSLVGVLIGTVAAIRATDKRIRTEIGAIKADFTSVRFGIDEAFGQEFGNKVKKPLDKVFVNMDIFITITGTDACLRTDCGPIILTPCGEAAPTTVNGVQSSTPTILVLRGGEQVGTLNPATGVHTVPECDPCPPCEPATVRTTDGATEIAEVDAGDTYDLPQTRIPIVLANGNPSFTTLVDTGFGGGYIEPDTVIPRITIYEGDGATVQGYTDIAIASFTAGVSDKDAAVYIARVEAMDAAYLEAGVRTAINALFIGLKADGNFDALMASCLMVAARTVNGALVPVHANGTVPTNNGFVIGDYNRKTGLLGNGTSKWLMTNRNNNADGQNDQSMGVWISIVGSQGSNYMGAGTTDTGTTAFGRRGTPNEAGLFVRHRSSTLNTTPGNGTSTGLFGVSRSASTGYTLRVGGADTAITQASQAPLDRQMAVFASQGPVTAFGWANARLQFYWQGPNLNMATLESRINTYLTAIAAAIP